MAHPKKDNKQELRSRVRPRVAVDYPAVFTGDDGSGHGTVINLTPVGGEIKSHVQFPIGARLDLHIQPPAARPRIVITLAIVRWKKDDRFGLEFIQFGDKAKEQLEDMLNQRENSAAD